MLFNFNCYKLFPQVLTLRLCVVYFRVPGESACDTVLVSGIHDGAHSIAIINL